MKWLLLPALVFTVAFFSCKKKNSSFSQTPFITYNGISPDSVRAGSSEDTIYISFKFQDGDGDLGNDQNSGNYDIYMKSNKDTSEFRYYFPPQMLDGITDFSKGISGTCYFYVPAALFIIEDSTKLRDTINFKLYIKDRALNTSDTIQTENVILKR